MQHPELLLQYVYQSNYNHLYIHISTVVIILCYVENVHISTVELASRVLRVQCFSVFQCWLPC